MSVHNAEDSAPIVDRWVEMSTAKLCTQCSARDPSKERGTHHLANKNRKVLFPERTSFGSLEASSGCIFCRKPPMQANWQKQATDVVGARGGGDRWRARGHTKGRT